MIFKLPDPDGSKKRSSPFFFRPPMWLVDAALIGVMLASVAGGFYAGRQSVDPSVKVVRVPTEVVYENHDCPEDAALFWSGVTNAQTACLNVGVAVERYVVTHHDDLNVTAGINVVVCAHQRFYEREHGITVMPEGCE